MKLSFVKIYKCDHKSGIQIDFKEFKSSRLFLATDNKISHFKTGYA